ncbi:MAG: M64 family metallopeptidase [Bacteroidaceae bacterium]
MNKNIYILIGLVLAIGTLQAQDFKDYFVDKTLRIDYIFSGNAQKQSIAVDEFSQFPLWAGRRFHLSALPLKGNGQVEMKDAQTEKIIYKTSFSSLFQEWLTTDEALTTVRAFENTFLLPYPKQKATVTVSLFDNRGKSVATLTHNILPDDILIHQRGNSSLVPYKYLVQNGSSEECIDIAILAEGYTKEEMDLFYKDALSACESLFAHAPFNQLKNKFNVVAVASESKDSGVSIPGKNVWKNTAFNSHFNTFYSDRYLTTSSVKSIHNALSNIPYEHIIILANTEQYGGGGIYNAFTLTTAHHSSFKPVIVHEFGHSFAGLADEYYYEQDLFSDTYPFDVEPWEQNITTFIDFSKKWKDLLPIGTPIPTLPSQQQTYPLGVYEGGGYSFKGIYRSAPDCRMKTNAAPAFCPVCQRAITQMINFYTNK